MQEWEGDRVVDSQIILACLPRYVMDFNLGSTNQSQKCVLTGTVVSFDLIGGDV